MLGLAVGNEIKHGYHNSNEEYGKEKEYYSLASPIIERSCGGFVVKQSQK
jgi:hypothetical protein